MMNNKPGKRGAKLLQLLMRIPVPWIFLLTYLIGVGLELIVRPYAHTQPGAYVPIAGAVLLAVGAAIAGWGLVLFRKARTTTVPGRTSSTLVRSGPYRFCRNPMYVGLGLAYLGEAAILRQFWPAVLLPVIVVYLNWVVIPVEEARLIETFGEEYKAYSASVRRWI